MERLGGDPDTIQTDFRRHFNRGCSAHATDFSTGATA